MLFVGKPFLFLFKFLNWYLRKSDLIIYKPYILLQSIIYNDFIVLFVVWTRFLYFTLCKSFEYLPIGF